MEKGKGREEGGRKGGREGRGKKGKKGKRKIEHLFSHAYRE